MYLHVSGPITIEMLLLSVSLEQQFKTLLVENGHLIKHILSTYINS